MSFKFQVVGSKLKITSIMRLTFCIFAFLLFCFSFAVAQIDLPLRIELESARDQQAYKYVSLENQGVAVFYKSAELNADTAQWVFIHYDTNLVKTNQYKLRLHNSFQYFAEEFSNNKLYLFFQKPARNKKDTLKNYLLEWNLKTLDFQLFDLQKYREPTFSSVHVKDDYLFFIVDEKKSKSICYYNVKTDVKQTFQIVDEEVTSIESFCLDTLSKTTNFCMFIKNKQGTRSELFVTDYSGNLKERVVFPYYEDFIYNSAKIACVGRDSLLLIGGYSNNKEKKSKGSFSGIYTIPFSKNKFYNKNSYPFGSLLANDTTLNMKHLTEANLLTNLHITQNNGKVFAISEFCYPEYQYSVSSYRSYGYSGYDPPTQAFTGFRFLNAFISEFDKEGSLLHEWYFPIQNVLTKSFNNLVGVYQDKEENSLFFYVNFNEIVSQFVNKNRLLSPQTAIPVELTNKADVLEYSVNVYMQHWYDKNFLVSGYQFIKNAHRGKGKRYVFFLNKLICE